MATQILNINATATTLVVTANQSYTLKFVCDAQLDNITVKQGDTVLAQGALVGTAFNIVPTSTSITVQAGNTGSSFEGMVCTLEYVPTPLQKKIVTTKPGYVYLFQDSSNATVNDVDSGYKLLDYQASFGTKSFKAIGDSVEIIGTAPVVTLFQQAPVSDSAGDGGKSEDYGYITRQTVGYADDGYPIIEMRAENRDGITNLDAAFCDRNYLYPCNFYSRYVPTGSFINVRTCSRAWFGHGYMTSFSTELPSVTNCDYAWQYCVSMTSFSTNLPSVMSCSGAWNTCHELLSFSSELQSVTNCSDAWWDCAGITSFSSELPSATNCSGAWRGCNNLVTFNKKGLPSCTNAYNAFGMCKLPKEEIDKILTSLPDRTGLTKATITFTGCPGASTCDASIATAKNWTVQV